MKGIPMPDSISPKQQRIAELARQMPDTALHSLSHHIDQDWMHEAFRRTRKDGARGVDGQSGTEYAANLEANLEALLTRAKTGDYRAPPVRRVHIPKGKGKTRPLGIPTFEDKVLQRAAVMALEPVYEQDFLPCSYGFRPGRSAHQALDALWKGLMRMDGGWVLDVDIRGFFDALDHRHLQRILRQRVTDGVLVRLVGKWLNAGVMEDGALRRPKTGAPQGGVISPLLSNIYLHEVVDVWFESMVKPRLRGHGFLIRYADDFVLCFEQEEDARRVMEVLPKRLGKYGLDLHPDKTRLVRFERPPRPRGPKPPRREDRPETFDLLGFTHYWGLSREKRWIIKRKTAKDRFARTVRAIAEWCRRNRCVPIRDQHAILSRKLHGHYAYFGITGNGEALVRLRYEVVRIWRKWLSRRSQRAWLSVEKFGALMRRYPLPAARVVNSIYR